MQPPPQSPGPRLAICCSQRQIRLALQDAEGELHHSGTGNAQAKDLSAATDQLLRQQNLQIHDLQAILLDLGPGSYTGLRVAVTLARFLGTFARVPIACATSLELIALATLRRDPQLQGRKLRPILDARRGRWHHAGVQTGAQLSLAAPPRADSIDQLRATLGEDELLLIEPRSQDSLTRCLPGAEWTLQSDYGAAELCDPALSLRPCNPAELEPLYLMGSYAETPKAGPA